MKRTLQKNHNSLFAYIPRGVCEYFELEAGEQLDFRIEGDYIKAMPMRPSCKDNAQAATHEPC